MLSLISKKLEGEHMDKDLIFKLNRPDPQLLHHQSSTEVNGVILIYAC